MLGSRGDRVGDLSEHRESLPQTTCALTVPIVILLLDAHRQRSHTSLPARATPS